MIPSGIAHCLVRSCFFCRVYTCLGIVPSPQLGLLSGLGATVAEVLFVRKSTSANNVVLLSLCLTLLTSPVGPDRLPIRVNMPCWEHHDGQDHFLLDLPSQLIIMLDSPLGFLADRHHCHSSVSSISRTDASWPCARLNIRIDPSKGVS